MDSKLLSIFMVVLLMSASVFAQASVQFSDSPYSSVEIFQDEDEAPSEGEDDGEESEDEGEDEPT